MSVTVVPVLSVAGQSISLGDDTSPLVAVGKLSLRWGRQSVLAQPTPAVQSLTVLDRSPGATFARRTDLKSRQVVTGWRSSSGATGTNFRGRITDVNVVHRPAGGFLVTLALSSQEVDLATYTAAEGTSWPAETAAARRDRIMALLPAGALAAIRLPSLSDLGPTTALEPGPDFSSYPMAAADVGGKTALDLLRSLFVSLYPVPMVYDPATNEVTYAPRRRHRAVTTGGTAAAGRLALVDGLWCAAPIGNGAPLDSGLLPYSGSLNQPLDSAVTLVDVGFINSDTGQDDHRFGLATALLPDVTDPAAVGRQPLKVDTVASGNGDTAGALAVSYAQLVGGEARLPRLEAVTYGTKRFGGFQSDQLAALLLAGRESAAEYFLGRSWLPQLGQRPVVGVIGASITYAGGEWEVSLQTAPVSVEAATKPLTVAGAQAAGVTVPLSALSESLTFGDMAFVEVGAGYTTTTQP